MILIYSKKDIHYVIKLFSNNKSILVFNYYSKNKNFNNKFINKMITYLNFLGFVVIMSYQLKINVYFKQSQTHTETVGLTQKV